VQCVAFAQNSRRFITCGHDARLLLWSRLKSCSKLIGIAELGSRFVTSCDISPNSYVMATGGLNNRCSIYVYDHTSPLMTAPAQEFTNPHHMLVSCNFIDEGKVVCAHGNQCFLHDIYEPKPSKSCQFLCHKGQISSTDAIYGHPMNFITCSIDKHVKIWDTRMREPGLNYRLASELNDVKSCRHQPNIFAVCHDKNINVFDVRFSKPMISFDAYLNDSELISLEMSNSGRIVIASDDQGTISGYDLGQQQQNTNPTMPSASHPALQLMNMADNRLSMNMSNDGQTLLIGSQSGDIFLTQLVQ